LDYAILNYGFVWFHETEKQHELTDLLESADAFRVPIRIKPAK
jgi:hypothetical protein